MAFSGRHGTEPMELSSDNEDSDFYTKLLPRSYYQQCEIERQVCSDPLLMELDIEPSFGAASSDIGRPRLDQTRPDGSIVRRRADGTARPPIGDERRDNFLNQRLHRHRTDGGTALRVRRSRTWVLASYISLIWVAWTSITTAVHVAAAVVYPISIKLLPHSNSTLTARFRASSSPEPHE